MNPYLNTSADRHCRADNAEQEYEPDPAPDREPELRIVFVPRSAPATFSCRRCHLASRGCCTLPETRAQVDTEEPARNRSLGPILHMLQERCGFGRLGLYEYEET